MTEYVIATYDRRYSAYDYGGALLPDVAPGESLRLTRTETGWDVRRLVKRGQTVIKWDRDARSGLVQGGTVSELWADAPEQGEAPC